MAEFRLGDVVEVLPGKASREAEIYIGQEGTVQELFVSYMTFGEARHTVLMRDGISLDVAVSCLRKKRPPQNDETLDTVTPLKVVRWSECPWRPAGVRA